MNIKITAIKIFKKIHKLIMVDFILRTTYNIEILKEIRTYLFNIENMIVKLYYNNIRLLKIVDLNSFIRI